ncbi:MAG: hypothetical protein AAB682_01530 [Patescibacteria group bacterium]
MIPGKHEHSKIKLAVSGAAETGHCGESALPMAKELGRQIVLQGAVLVTGATTGMPLWTAMGAKEAGGFVVGLSPAATEREHVEKYKLPLEYLDIIIYTGAGYSGRDLLMTRTSDAIFLGCGRIGTIHEFTIAFEDNKPIGILEGEWSTDEVIKNIIDNSNRAEDNQKIIFNPDPKLLVEKIIQLVRKDKEGEV